MLHQASLSSGLALVSFKECMELVNKMRDHVNVKRKDHETEEAVKSCEVELNTLRRAERGH